MDRREYNIEIFEGTQRILKNKYQDKIAESISKSQVFFENLNILGAIKSNNLKTRFIINKSRSLEAAKDFLDIAPGKKVAVLNFASAKNPGGGVTSGASAQEESLCRVSSLYNVITNDKFKRDYYNYHKSISGTIYTNRLIYTPDIIVLKDDDGELLSKSYTVDMITCAAPNLNFNSNIKYNGDKGSSTLTDEELFKVHYSRCLHIIKAAADNNVEALVLGAFGCGVFRNNPEIVAKAMKKALEDSPYKFEVVLFPIYCRNWETTNYDAFKKVFGER